MSLLRLVVVPLAAVASLLVTNACGGLVTTEEPSSEGGPVASSPSISPSTTVPTPGTATVGAPLCAARRNACASGITRKAWAESVVDACAKATTKVCGDVVFGFGDGACLEHVVFQREFPRAFVDCVVADSASLCPGTEALVFVSVCR